MNRPHTGRASPVTRIYPGPGNEAQEAVARDAAAATPRPRPDNTACTAAPAPGGCWGVLRCCACDVGRMARSCPLNPPPRTHPLCKRYRSEAALQEQQHQHQHQHQ
jgi:hypothetical protein